MGHYVRAGGPLTVGGLAAFLENLGPDVQDYECWVECDPSDKVEGVTIDHDNRRVWVG